MVTIGMRTRTNNPAPSRPAGRDCGVAPAPACHRSRSDHHARLRLGPPRRTYQQRQCLSLATGKPAKTLTALPAERLPHSFRLASPCRQLASLALKGTGTETGLGAWFNSVHGRHLSPERPPRHAHPCASADSDSPVAWTCPSSMARRRCSSTAAKVSSSSRHAHVFRRPRALTFPQPCNTNFPRPPSHAAKPGQPRALDRLAATLLRLVVWTPTISPCGRRSGRYSRRGRASRTP